MMQIREARTEDFDELRAFYVRMNEVINVRNDHFDPDNAVFPSDDMISKAIRNRELFIGIEDEIIVAGCIMVGECEPAYSGADWRVDAGEGEFWLLHALRVAPEYEGRGFAKLMLSFVIGVAPERGKKAIRLDVLDGYPVERLYRRFGFEYIDTVEISYEDIGHPEKFRLLEKEILQERNISPTV